MLSQVPFTVPDTLLIKAKALPALKTVVAGADTAGVLESVQMGIDEGLITPVLVGRKDLVSKSAETIGLDISSYKLIEADGDHDTAQKTAEAAADKNIQLIMKGHIHTDSLMGALLAPFVGLANGNRLTHIFHMTVPESDKPLLITDGALNVAPSQKTLMACVKNAVALAHQLDNPRPRIAILSATESRVESVPSSILAGELADWAANSIPDADFLGPLAFDLAVSPVAAEAKGLNHPVAGNADIIVVPNIETGNGLFKMLVYMRSACAAGVVLGGRIPVTITSRADPPQARLASLALAVIAAS